MSTPIPAPAAAESFNHYTRLGISEEVVKSYIELSAEIPDFSSARTQFIGLSEQVWKSVMCADQIQSAVHIQASLNSAFSDYAEHSFPNGHITTPSNLVDADILGLDASERDRLDIFLQLQELDVKLSGDLSDDYINQLNTVWTKVTNRAQLVAAREITKTIQSALEDGMKAVLL